MRSGLLEQPEQLQLGGNGTGRRARNSWNATIEWPLRGVMYSNAVINGTLVTQHLVFQPYTVTIYCTVQPYTSVLWQRGLKVKGDWINYLERKSVGTISGELWNNFCIFENSSCSSIVVHANNVFHAFNLAVAQMFPHIPKGKHMNAQDGNIIVIIVIVSLFPSPWMPSDIESALSTRSIEAGIYHARLYCM